MNFEMNLLYVQQVAELSYYIDMEGLLAENSERANALLEDGINYSREITVNSTTPTYSYSYPSHPLCIGFRVGNFFRGTIDLKETSVYINSTYNSNYKKMYTWRAYNIIADSPSMEDAEYLLFQIDDVYGYMKENCVKI